MVLKSRSKVKVRRSKILVPLESSCHKEYTYEILITYHSKDMANVKVFADRQTNRQMDRPKTICPRSFNTSFNTGP
jgi:hypothetical protein